MRVREWRDMKNGGPKDDSRGEADSNVTSQHLHSREQRIDSSMGARLDSLATLCTVCGSCARGVPVHDAAVRLRAHRSRARVPEVLPGFERAPAGALPGRRLRWRRLRPAESGPAALLPG